MRALGGQSPQGSVVRISSYCHIKKPTEVGILYGGEGGIRTPVGFYAKHDFESCAFNQLSHLSSLELDLLARFETSFKNFAFWSVLPLGFENPLSKPDKSNNISNYILRLVIQASFYRCYMLQLPLLCTCSSAG